MNSTAFVPQLIYPQSSSYEAYLSFSLNEQTSAVFSMDQVQEVFGVDAQHVTPMPNMPSCVLGLLTRRNRVMWVVDLAQMLLSDPLPSNLRTYNVIILRLARSSQRQAMVLGTDHQYLLSGVIVSEVKGVIRCSPNSIQALQTYLSSSLAPYLKGCLLQQNDLFLALNAEAIVGSPLLQSY